MPAFSVAAVSVQNRFICLCVSASIFRSEPFPFATAFQSLRTHFLNSLHRFQGFCFNRVDPVFLSAVGSVGLYHCDPPLVPQLWRLRIGSRSSAKKSQPHSLIDLSREPLDVNLSIKAKDKYLNFEVLYIKLLSLPRLLGDTLACNTLHHGSHLCHHLRLRHRTTCPTSTPSHQHLPCFHHHHHHLDFIRNLARRRPHRSLRARLRPNQPDPKSRWGISFVPLKFLQLKNGRLMWITMTPPKSGALTCR